MSERDDVRRLREPGWWRGWNRLTVSDAASFEPIRFSRATLALAQSELGSEGWAQLLRPFEDDLIERLREGVLALRARGLPAVFLWVYDETWMLFARLDAVWREMLGDSYRFLPCFWAWYIPVGADRSGWPPHRDRSKGPPTVSPDGRPLTMSAWIPLGRATPANGCMYLVPAPWTVKNRSLIRPQDARALPADPGDVLIWRQDIWHWGGRSSGQATEPRISVSLEIQAGTEVRYEGPLLDPGRPPSLGHRLGLIGANILRYRHFEANKKLAALGAELVRALADVDDQGPLG
ncbi:MAG: phytanoyl-CoA dioxygenase family protein [Myxococcota bacterium]